MRVFLDPRLFLFTEQEWEEYTFVERMSALLRLLQQCERIEKQAGLLFRVVRFRLPEALQSYIHEMNPMVNRPEQRTQYRTQYLREILPSLMKRFDICPDARCEQQTINRLTVAQAASDMDICENFAAELRLCAECGDSRPTVLIYDEDAKSLIARSGFFAHEHKSKQIDVLSIIDPTEFLDLDTLAGRDRRIALAIEILRANYSSTIPQLSSRSISNLNFSQDFWMQFTRTDFRSAYDLYLNRILFVLLQIATNIDIDASLHCMTSQTINYKGVNLQKWNAHVFKMGPSDQDRRCSRIYYANTSEGILIQTFEPDAH